MITKLFRKLWTHLLITLDDSYTVDGFEKTQKKFKLPEGLAELDPATKREMTICNLFASQNLSIPEIVRVLDSSLHQVVPTLIKHQLIKERREKQRNQAKPESNPLSILPSNGQAQSLGSQASREPTVIDGSRPSSRFEKNSEAFAGSSGVREKSEITL
jgi:hypothetical protein